MKSWRSGPKRGLFARTIPSRDIPILIRAMIDDGLTAYIMSDGVHWSFCEYSLSSKSVMDAWGLTKSQYRRVRDYILVNDPFMEELQSGL